MSDSDNDDTVIKNTDDVLGLFNESLWVLHSTTELTLGQLTSYQRASNIPMLVQLMKLYFAAKVDFNFIIIGLIQCLCHLLMKTLHHLYYCNAPLKII